MKKSIEEYKEKEKDDQYNQHNIERIRHKLEFIGFRYG